jgi:hypothetical protein
MGVNWDNGTLLSIQGHWTNGHAIDNTVAYLREEADPAEAARDVLNNWQDHIVPWFLNNYTLDGIHYVDTNSVDGVVGFLPPDDAKPKVGGRVGAGAAPAVCILVKKVIESRRGQRSGRFYLGPPQEDDTDENGGLNTDVRLAIDAAFADFLAGTDDDHGGGNGACHVLHAKLAPLASTSSKINSYKTDTNLAVQRRRIGR